MARKPGPVRPLVKDAKAYEALIRRTVLVPFFRDLRMGVRKVEALNELWYAMDEAVALAAVRGVPIESISEILATMHHHHRDRLIASFRSALGIDIKPILQDLEISEFLRRKLSENVDLIRTIPPRAHQSLKVALQKELEVAPFDRQRLSQLINREYGKSGYVLRRIVRDQTNKVTGQLTEIRHRQLGIRGYQWATAGDERVRPTHRANEGRLFRWDRPPVGTGHPGWDVMCRCIAIPALLKADRERLKAETGN